jgi:hypothetical protein
MGGIMIIDWVPFTLLFVAMIVSIISTIAAISLAARDAKVYIDLKVGEVLDEIRHTRQKTVDQAHKIVSPRRVSEGTVLAF